VAFFSIQIPAARFDGFDEHRCAAKASLAVRSVVHDGEDQSEDEETDKGSHSRFSLT
jgi:hypothetical protein